MVTINRVIDMIMICPVSCLVKATVVALECA